MNALVINDRGELLSFGMTAGHVDDRQPVHRLVQRLWDKLFGDKGSISQPLFEQLFEHSIKLITSVLRA